MAILVHLNNNDLADHDRSMQRMEDQVLRDLAVDAGNAIGKKLSIYRSDAEVGSLWWKRTVAYYRLYVHVLGTQWQLLSLPAQFRDSSAIAVPCQVMEAFLHGIMVGNDHCGRRRQQNQIAPVPCKGCG